MPEMTYEEIAKLPTTRMVCVWQDGKDKNRLCFMDVEDDGSVRAADGVYTFKRRPRVEMLKARPGTMWDVPTLTEEEGNQFYLGRAEYAGQWNQDELALASWWAKHRAHELKHQMATERSKAMNDDRLKEALRPVRLAYSSMSWRDRRILLACVLEIIAGG